MSKQSSPAPAKEQELDIDFRESKSSTFTAEKPPTDTNAQRMAILQHLQKGQSLTTLFAREKMGIMHPGGRVMELRKMGYNILLHWVLETDVAGTPHRVGHYVLHQDKIKGVE